MNSKSKIILGLSAILAMSAGVAATSTFAWFSTNHTTTVSITNIGVRSNNGNLWVEASASSDANAGGMKIDTKGTESVTPQVSGVGSMYDISGDGVAFYQPQWNTNSVNKSTGIGLSAHGMNACNNDTAGKLSYREFFLTFHNGNADSLTTDPAIAVYVDSTSTIVAGATGSLSSNAAACTRIAILNQAGTSVLFYWQRSSEDVTTTPKYQYIAPDANKTTTDGIYGVAGYAKGDASTIVTDATVTVSGKHNVVLGSSPVAITDGTSTTQAQQKIISSINPGASSEVMVRIWCEGTCSTCSTDAAAGGVVAATLGFAAI